MAEVVLAAVLAVTGASSSEAGATWNEHNEPTAWPHLDKLSRIMQGQVRK